MTDTAGDGTFGSPTPLAGLREQVPAQLQRWVELANRAGWLDMGRPDSCVLTSHALAAYLELAGREPWLVRVEACAFGPRTGTCLGSEGDGTRRPAAAPGKWSGHLAVGCDGHLMDPTLDQINDSGAEHYTFGPVVFPLSAWWDECRAVFFTDGNGNMLRYKRFSRQAGWKSAPDARTSHWRPVLDLMTELDAPDTAAERVLGIT